MKTFVFAMTVLLAVPALACDEEYNDYGYQQTYKAKKKKKSYQARSWSYLGCSQTSSGCESKADRYGYSHARATLSSSCGGGRAPVMFDCFGR